MSGLQKETVGECAADTVFRWSLEDECGQELDGWIYIIGCREPLSIKIGFTKKHPRDRLRQLQTGCPTTLRLLGWYPGSHRQERELHEQMAAYRISGEWFRVDEASTDILRGPITAMFINNALTGHEKEFLA